MFEGEQVVFNCTAYQYDSIQWALNQKLINFIKGLDWTVSYDDDGLRRFSTLTIEQTNVSYNDSIVTCIGNNVLFNSDSESSKEDTVMYVQGTIVIIELFHTCMAPWTDEVYM